MPGWSLQPSSGSSRIAPLAWGFSRMRVQGQHWMSRRPDPGSLSLSTTLDMGLAPSAFLKVLPSLNRGTLVNPSLMASTTTRLTLMLFMIVVPPSCLIARFSASAREWKRGASYRPRDLRVLCVPCRWEGPRANASFPACARASLYLFGRLGHLPHDRDLLVLFVGKGDV